MAKMNDQQYTFLVCKTSLRYLEMIEKERPLNSREIQEREVLKNYLFESILKFGMSTAKKYLPKPLIDDDIFKDIQQSLAVVFFEQLPRYDPKQTTPTTFFRCYFNQAISECLRTSFHHLSKYEIKKSSIVQEAINYYESQGYKWTIPMISEYTGLSEKIVKQTISIAEYSIHVNIDDVASNLQSKICTPEEQYLKEERAYAIHNAIKDTLTAEELSIFLNRINLYGNKELTYQTVADNLKLDIKALKKNGVPF